MTVEEHAESVQEASNSDLEMLLLPGEKEALTPGTSITIECTGLRKCVAYVLLLLGEETNDSGKHELPDMVDLDGLTRACYILSKIVNGEKTRDEVVAYLRGVRQWMDERQFKFPTIGALLSKQQSDNTDCQEDSEQL